jgi:DNA primase
MNLIQEIKARLDIVALAGEHLELQRSGKNWKALCPFHPDKHPSLVIFPDSQRFTCFGAGCNQSGDLFDLVGRLNQWDFPRTLRHLAGRAGIEMAPLVEAEQVEQATRRLREQVFSTAAGYFQGYLFRPAPRFQGAGEGEIKPDLGYALGRGWSKETLAEAGVGSYGGDREGLRRCLQAAGLDLDLPAAVALLGRRGKIAEWAQKHGLQAPKAWLEGDRIPGMPGQMLVYAHLERGRAVYLSGRSIEHRDARPGQLQHWNPPRELVGPRRPYFNLHWFSSPSQGRQDRYTKLEYALVVEGQGDALTLAQWGIPALALVGCSLPEPGRDEPVEGEPGLLDSILSKSRTARLVVALDSDQAGLLAALKVACGLEAAGLPADRLHLLRWPEGDANDWLLAGAGEEQARALIEAAPSWLDELVREAQERPKDEQALMGAFQALAGLPENRVILQREGVCRRLKMRKATFDELLRSTRLQQAEREREAESPGGPGSLFLVMEGGIFKRSTSSQGYQALEKLSNFTARIEQEIRRDDGQQAHLQYQISGELGGVPLPPARVMADEFKRMDWVASQWGAGAIIEAGHLRQDQLRAAIQYLSQGCQKRRVFTHTGWRQLDGQAGRVYLSGSGALGLEGSSPQGVAVELDGDLRAYSLPLMPEDPGEALRLSLQFLDLAPLEITVPIWASIWLAPLCEMLRPKFVLWLYGRTGTLKSTLAGLALNHYGAGFDGAHFPANFTDTPYRLEQKCFLAKDALLVIDDFAPQRNQRLAQEYLRAAGHIIRAVGNLAGRGRMTQDLRARQSFRPRGLVIVTGEDLPDSESLAARLFVVEFKVDCVDLERLAAL